MAHKFTFTDYVIRGRTEREYEVEVTYSVTDFVTATFWQPAEGGEVELLSITGQLEWAELTADEVDGLYDAACDRCEQDLAEYHAEMADYRAELRADDLATASEASVPPMGKAA